MLIMVYRIFPRVYLISPPDRHTHQLKSILAFNIFESQARLPNAGQCFGGQGAQGYFHKGQRTSEGKI